MAEVLDRAAALANGRWPLIVALIPFPSMLDDAAWIRACAWSRIALERCDRGLPARFLGEALAGRARVVDLLPALRAQADASDAPFIPSEGHLSARGHRLVAQALEPILAAALSSPVVD
jgi:hypothetical protein